MARDAVSRSRARHPIGLVPEGAIRVAGILGGGLLEKVRELTGISVRTGGVRGAGRRCCQAYWGATGEIRNASQFLERVRDLNLSRPDLEALRLELPLEASGPVGARAKECDRVLETLASGG